METTSNTTAEFFDEASKAIDIAKKDETGDSYIGIGIITLAFVGITVNLAGIVILVKKHNPSMFHTLLRILITSDTVVVFGCTMIWGIPNSELWEWYELFAYPILGPIIVPITQISMMISVYCTTLMSFDRYTRIGKRCQMKDCSYITDDNLKFYLVFLLLFPIIFYIPRFFESHTLYHGYNISVNCHFGLPKMIPCHIFSPTSGQEIQLPMLCLKPSLELLVKKTFTFALGLHQKQTLNRTIKEFPELTPFLQKTSDNIDKKIQEDKENGIEKSVRLIEEINDKVAMVILDNAARSPETLSFDNLKAPNFTYATCSNERRNLFATMLIMNYSDPYPSLQFSKMRGNVWYYGIYVTGLQTMFGNIIPLFLLLYLNFYTVSALIKLGNETKNVVSSRKHNSRPRRKASKEKSSNPKSNDKQHQDMPNTEYDGKTTFVSENTTSLDHTKEYHEHIKNRAPELNYIASNYSKEIQSSNKKLVGIPRAERRLYSCPSLSSNIPEKNQPQLDDATLVLLKTAVTVDNSIPASGKHGSGIKSFSRNDLIPNPKNQNCHDTTLETFHISGAESVKSRIDSNPSPVKSDATTEHRSTATDYADIFSIREKANAIHISGDAKNKMEHAQREHHINATLIDTDDIRRRMSMIPTKLESKFQGFLTKETESESKVCSATFRGERLCKNDQYEDVELTSIPRRANAKIDSAVQVVSTRRCISSATNGSPHVRSRNQLTHQGSHTDARMILLRTKEARITRIALGIVSLYILCHIWRLIPNIYDAIYGSDKQYPRWLEHLVGFSHIMVVFNSAINFLLYLVL